MNRKILLLQCITTFLLAFHPVQLIAGDVKLGNLFSITSALPGDDVYVPNVAYNSKHREYLVVYHWTNVFLSPIRQIHAARISEKGDYIENFIISDDAAKHCGSPDVAYDPVNDRYLVAWMWDKNGNQSNWDLRGRFIPWDGPSAGVGSFVVSAQVNWDEYSPQVAYGETQKDFLVVTNLFRNDGSPIKPYIGGLRIKADGSGMPGGGSFDFSIIHGTENRINPQVVYNSVRDQYLVVYDNTGDVLGYRINGFNGTLFGAEFSIAGWPDAEDKPAVSFSSKKDIYVVTWDSKRLSGNGEVYGRFVNGDGTVSTVFRLDDDWGGVRPDFTTAVACKQSTDECLVYWSVINSNTYYTFGRQLHAGGTVEGGFPYVNLNTVATWGSNDPQLAIGGGRENYFMAFKGMNGGTPIIQGLPTLLLSPPFQWNLFLPAITTGKNQ